MHDEQSKPWEDRPLSNDELAQLRTRLERMSDHELLKFYDASHALCKLDKGRGPRAPFIQQIVAAWKVLRKRGLAG